MYTCSIDERANKIRRKIVPFSCLILEIIIRQLMFIMMVNIRKEKLQITFTPLVTKSMNFSTQR